ncbi:AraC family transcriptional regulator [Paracidovorax wautersii]|uniref:AraC-type DNA-binding protein n=1 Tax=Paracidovorax wautersii TaxID=1177982 RepID=A0A1I2FW51_9BURK|nr:AraC family transcriptional regulator [Paracidovorax wautersii]SFF09565.1 AraC-type DNA-binding protein [Paracidovorax wautersii]
MQHAHSPQAAPRAGFWHDPALPFAESRRAVRSRACYRMHTHTTLSIGVVDAGQSVFTSQGRSIRLAASALVVVPAGCAHACNPAPGTAWSYQMLHLDAGWADRTLAAAGFPPWPRHALVLHDAAAYQAFDALNQRLFSDASAVDKAASLARFVTGGSWRCGDALLLEPQSSGATAVARAQALLQGDPARAWPLPALAQAVGLSPRALVRAFKAATGLTPHAYQLDLRVNAARAQLRAGNAPADVAHGLGFYDQSHFHHTFRQHVAATPGDYRR